MQKLTLTDPFSSGSTIYPAQHRDTEDYYKAIIPPLLWHFHPCSSAFQEKYAADIWIAQKGALGKIFFTFFGNKSISAPHLDKKWIDWQLTPLGERHLHTVDEVRTIFSHRTI